MKIWVRNCCAFVYITKAFDSIHGEVTSWAFRKAGVEALLVCALMAVYEAAHS